MILRTLSLSLLLLNSNFCYSFPELPAPTEDLQNDPLFKTQHLLNNDGIRKHLRDHYNAQEFQVQTEDKITIHGTYIERANSTHTTIVPGGFYPGNQESMATWVKALPQEGNIIFFDARYHGREGSSLALLRSLPEYGIHEYKDILAVMNFAKEKYKPIIMNPLCAGTMHTIHALNKLKEKNILSDYNVKGLIIDSAYVSGTHVLPAGEYHFREKAIPQLLRSKIYTQDTSTEVKDRFLYKFIWNFLGYPFVSLLHWFAQSGIQKNDPITRIDDKIAQLQHIPTLYIHAQDDKYAPVTHIHALKEKHANNLDEIAIFENSDHANNILKKKYEYRNIVQKFIIKVMALKTNGLDK
jgi:pimeloyl-ACP methyl ester carboxylesterase